MLTSLTPLLLLTLTTTPLISAATIQILAHQNFGDPDPFEFRPNEITAAPGDILEFHFGGPGEGVLGGNHSVAQGVFDDPCRPADGGFWSGFQAINATSTEADFVFRVEVNDTQPMVFYCAQGPHCTRGMHGVVNGQGDETLRSYRGRIDKNFEATVPAMLPGMGGRLVPNSVENILPAEDPNAAGALRVSAVLVLAVVAAFGMVLV
jgi:hypothetical protein